MTPAPESPEASTPTPDEDRRPIVESFEAGTMAGAGSFRCENCGFALALNETDQVPSCPRCSHDSFIRSSLFAQPRLEPTYHVVPAEPGWLDRAREQVGGRGPHLAFDEDGGVRLVAISEGWSRVGRSPAAEIRVDDPTVSRRHALLHREGPATEALDDRSLNGIFLNGVKIDRMPLNDGDALSMGRFTLHWIDIRENAG